MAQFETLTIVAGQLVSPELLAQQLLEARAAAPHERLGILIRLRDALNLEIAKAATEAETHAPH